MLLQRAMHLVASAGHRVIMLAVDEANAPAVALYRRHKFTSTARKLAMIRTLDG
jgi:ribosomal protein S18 acetylase RimI-like enzyme